ncbi:hypothetical protein VNO80_18231 [Phaseolus coccineus]|uniref:Transmembrane protein n=1 Tax=Phaseolus coccineus TaxID=3886 RepID=A0AAN9QYQ4_PHACN
MFGFNSPTSPSPIQYEEILLRDAMKKALLERLKNRIWRLGLYKIPGSFIVACTFTYFLFKYKGTGLM